MSACNMLRHSFQQQMLCSLAVEQQRSRQARAAINAISIRKGRADHADTLDSRCRLGRRAWRRRAHAQQDRLAAAAGAMGAASLNSIEYTGSGTVFGFGQAYEPGERWPRFVQRTYNAAINYQTPGMRLIQVRSQGEHPAARRRGAAGRGRSTHGAGRQRQIRLAGRRRPGRAQSRRGRRPPAAIVGDAARRDQSRAWPIRRASTATPRRSASTAARSRRRSTRRIWSRR